MFELRFGEPAPERRSVDQLRGIEGARVRKTYELLAKQFGVEWRGRRYDPKDWEKVMSLINASVLPRLVYMALPKLPFLQPVTRQQLALFTQVNPYPSFMIWLTSSNSNLLYQKRSR